MFIFPDLLMFVCMRKGDYAALVLVLLAGYSIIEPSMLRLTEIQVADNNVPKGFIGKKIAFITDIHCGTFNSPDRVAKMVTRVNREKPDLILFGGDFLFSAGDDAGECMKTLGELQAPLGSYSVLGNHDVWGDEEYIRAKLQEYGVRLLDNRAEWVVLGEDRIKVGGVGDLWTQSQDLTPTIEDVVDDDFVILLSHNPQYMEEIDSSLVDLMLAGHTHGGQILPVRLIAPYLPSRLRQKYVSGSYLVDETKLFVSNGVGIVILPIRFMTRPEVVVVKLNQ